MNEFNRPDGSSGVMDDNPQQTVYDEPGSPINIVVDNEDKQLYCRCGNPISKDDVFCSRCGTKTDYAFSHQVQHNIPAVQPCSAMPESYVGASFGGGTNLKNKFISLPLCFFFGLIGAHRFYEGRIVSGILKSVLLGASALGFVASLAVWAYYGFFASLLPMLLSIVGVGASVIGWLVDFIVLLTKPKKYEPKPPKNKS